MKIQLIEKIVRRAQGTNLQSLDLELDGTRLRLQWSAHAPAECAVPTNAGGDTGLAAGTGSEELAPGSVITAPACGKLWHRHPSTKIDATTTTTATSKTGEAIAFLQVGPLLSSIPAPFDGVVVERLVDEGTVVGYGTPVLRFTRAASPSM